MFYIYGVLKRTLHLFAILCMVLQGYSQVQEATGRVVDVSSRKPLAFVNIVAKGQQAGSTTDIDGRFKLTDTQPFETLLFSYVGYEPLVYTIQPTDNAKNLIIEMKRTSYELGEVKILPGVNPAHRIINKAVENKKKNDPEKLESFSYTVYNKMIFTGDFDSTYILDETKRSELDSSDLKALSFFDQRHLLLMEFVSKRQFMQPDRNKEVVTASRVSGLKNPMFAQLATQMQSFSFYPDFISIYDKNYLSPISKGSTGKYLFILEDTAWAGPDTVFIISFRPQKGKTFDAMKGLLYINTNGYALQNVIAEPVTVSQKSIEVNIQQKYEQVTGHWFPVQLNTDINYLMFEINDGRHVKGYGRSYLNNIIINPELNPKDFDIVELKLDKDATKKDSTYWTAHRHEPLNEKESETYRYIDSLGRANKIDEKITVYQTLLLGKVPLGLLDLDLDRILDYNEYEGFRLGAGLHTSKKISRRFLLGGYWAWGFRDNAMKYQGDFTLNLHYDKDVQLKLSYKNDVIESGGTELPFHRISSLSSEAFRDFLVEKMDAIEEYKAALDFRLLKYFHVELAGREHYRTATDDYLFSQSLNENISASLNTFAFTEASAGFRFAYGEKFVEMLGTKLSLGTDYPVVWARVSKGFNNVLNGQFDYTRFDLKVKYGWKTRKWGRPSFVAQAGYITGDLPYTLLFNGKANEGKYSVHAEYSFQTMGMNEFLSNRYAALFYQHNLGKLVRTKRLQPELILAHHMGIGALGNTDKHQNIIFDTLEHGYFESGVMIYNIYKLNFTGLGVGAFYKYGAYSSTAPEENLAVKFSLTFVL